jgi:hypothetical protein
MKLSFAAAAIFAASTSFVHAGEITGKARDSFARMQPGAHKSMTLATDVIVDGRVVGRDPSKSVRANIANSYYSLSAAGGEGGSGGDAGGAAAAD